MAGVLEIRVNNEDMFMEQEKQSSEEEEGEIVDNDDDDPFWVAPKQPDTRDSNVSVEGKR